MAINRGCYSDGDMRTNWCEIKRFLPHDEAKKVEKLAQGVACMVKMDCLDPNTYHLKDDVNSFHEYMKENQKRLNPNWVGPGGACGGLSDEALFREEPAVGFGTAFLAGEQLAVTAAHTIYDAGRKTLKPDIGNFRLIFDFHLTHCDTCSGSQNFELNRNFSEKTYSFTVLAYKFINGEEDWAILKLNKKVEGRLPLKLNFTKNVKAAQGASAADPVYMLGHPYGLPLKYTRNAFVQEQKRASKYFTANLDAFRSNSGSPVIRLDTHEVVGILFQGYMEDFDNRHGDGVLYEHHASASDKQNLKDNPSEYERCFKSTALTFLQATLTSIDIPHFPDSYARKIQQGLNVEGKCANNGCTQFNQMTLIPLGQKGKFNVRAVCFATLCPEPTCKQLIPYKEINMIILSHCLYTIECMNSNGAYVKETLKVEAGHAYNLDIRKWKFIELDINY